MKDYVHKTTRPQLTIESTGGANLGRCYNASYWKVTAHRRLSRECLEGLNDAGVLGFGQEFLVKSQCDGKEAPAFTESIPCVVIDHASGKVLDEPPVNPYSRTGELYGPYEQPYYVYECESRCDSSD